MQFNFTHQVTRNLAQKSLGRAEKLLRAKSAIPRHAELAHVARGLCLILRDAGLDRAVLGKELITQPITS